MSVVEGLYASFDLELSELAAVRMRTYLHDHPQDEFGRHRYTLADLGLSERRVREAFEDEHTRR